MTAEPLTAPEHSFREQAAAELRAHLARRRISGRALSRMLGKDDPSWVSRRLKGDIPMTTDDIDLIASALGITPLELLGGPPFRPVAPQTTADYPRTQRTITT